MQKLSLFSYFYLKTRRTNPRCWVHIRNNPSATGKIRYMPKGYAENHFSGSLDIPACKSACRFGHSGGETGGARLLINSAGRFHHGNWRAEIFSNLNWTSYFWPK
jgi:hypothetical protein